MNKEITKDQFVLMKIRLEENGGIEIHWNEIDSSSGQIIVDGLIRKSKRIPQEALTDEIRDLVEPLKEVIEAKSWENVEMIGFTMKGTTEKMVVVLSGKKQIKNGQKLPVNPKVAIEDDVFGVESQIKETVNNVIDKAFSYLYEGHCLQPELGLKENAAE